MVKNPEKKTKKKTREYGWLEKQKINESHSLERLRMITVLSFSQSTLAF